MKLKDTVIAWNPIPGGACVVLPLGSPVPFDLPSTTGGVWTWTWKTAPAKAKAFVLAEALHMIVRDKLDPMTVHTALCQVDEYLDACADDMPGVSKLRPD